jgi:hypothetical protein
MTRKVYSAEKKEVGDAKIMSAEWSSSCVGNGKENVRTMVQQHRVQSSTRIQQGECQDKGTARMKYVWDCRLALGAIQNFR